MINSIGSAYDYLSNYLNLTSSSSSATQSFDNVLDLADDALKTGSNNFESSLSVSETDKNSQVSSTNSSGGGSESSDEENSEMDLNKDGVVTIDEVIQYYAMQSASENGGEENSFQSFNNESLNYSSAKTAYSSSNGFSSTATSTSSMSLFV